MSGNTLNAAVWGGADVLISRNLNAVIPEGNDLFDMNNPEAEVITASITNGDATVTGAGFDSSLVGATVSGTGITGGTKVLSVTSPTSLELTANATATNASASLTIGATTGGWDFVGLLDGGQGFEEGIAVDSTDHNAWGYGVIATTYKGNKTTKTFTALEDNPTTLGLVYDVSAVDFTLGDDDEYTYEGDLGVRDVSEKVKIAFVTTSGSTEKRMVSKAYATIVPTSAGTDGEDSLSSKAFTATIVPDSDKLLWTVYKGAVA